MPSNKPLKLTDRFGIALGKAHDGLANGARHHRCDFGWKALGAFGAGEELCWRHIPSFNRNDGGRGLNGSLGAGLQRG